MHGGDLALLVLVLVFGCAAFFFGVVYLIGQLFVWFFRGLASLFGCGARPCRVVDHGPRRRICPRGGCHRVEYRAAARFCSQCGTRLV